MLPDIALQTRPPSQVCSPVITSAAEISPELYEFERTPPSFMITAIPPDCPPRILPLL